MSSRRQAVDKLDRTITRLYTYLSGSEEGEDASEPHPPSHHHHHQGPARCRRPRPQQQQHMQQAHHHHQEPEYQQPYAYAAAAGAASYGGAGQLLPGSVGGASSLGGSTPTSNNGSDHASEITFTESELALTHQATLPISGRSGESVFSFTNF